jgi:hypothetical protein
MCMHTHTHSLSQARIKFVPVFLYVKGVEEQMQKKESIPSHPSNGRENAEFGLELYA